jgi:hypothetical protein
MAAKKSQRLGEYGDIPKNIDGEPFYNIELDNDQTLLATIGLFCREYSMDLVKKDPIIARALRKIKDYISVELLDLFNL